MSVKRQHFTGTMIGFFIWFGVGVAVVWWLPQLVLKFFPQLTVHSTDPWLINPSDLTTRRVLANVLAKPGFRILLGIILTGLWMLLRIMWLFIVKVEHRPEWKRLGEQFKRLSLRESAEWVLDGRRQSPLAEFVTWSERGE